MGVPKKQQGRGKKSGAPQSASDLFEEAEMAFAMEDLDSANRCFAKAAQLEPENPEYVSGYGVFLAEVGQLQDAVPLLMRAVQLQPEAGHEKYMTLGQVMAGKEGEENYRKGIALLRSQVAQLAEHPEAAAAGAEEVAELAEHTRAMLGTGLCSLAECILEQAHAAEGGEAAAAAALAAVAPECEALLAEAAGLAPTSPEPLQVMASMRQHQGRAEEALALLRQSMAMWMKPVEEEEEDDAVEAAAPAPGAEASVDMTDASPAPAPAGAAARKAAIRVEAEDDEEDIGSEDTDDDDEEDDDSMGSFSEEGGDDDLPSFEFRFETAKLLLDLDDSVATVLQVLDGLLEENDEEPNVWLLKAHAHRAGGEWEAAAEAATQCRELAAKAGLGPEDEMVLELAELQADIETQTAAAKP